MVADPGRPSMVTRTVFVALLLAMWLPFPQSHADQLGRPPSPAEGDKCGLPDTTSEAYRLAASQNWGYGYDSLRADLVRWGLSPFIRIDSVGASVQNRALYLLTIEDTVSTPAPRQRVWIHARTHPNEVQGTWVTNEIIRILLDTTSLSRHLRKGCIFNIIPMINPDGVELKYARQNANGIDIESNWTAVPGEPEVQTLRRIFTALMTEPNPIRIALNMHSAYGDARYFVYHAASGTSDAYAVIQQRYINAVRSHFPGGIKPYNYFVSWVNAPSRVYPESWFWLNHREAVLALTYEDMNSSAARAFDSTANAIVRGIADELGLGGPTAIPDTPPLPATMALEQNFPNPFNPVTTIRYSIGSAMGVGEGSAGFGSGNWVKLAVYDILGKEVAVLVDGPAAPGTHDVRWDAGSLPSGVYFCRLLAGGEAASRRMLVIK